MCGLLGVVAEPDAGAAPPPGPRPGIDTPSPQSRRPNPPPASPQQVGTETALDDQQPIRELTDKRDDNSRTFASSDGILTVDGYTTPINYEAGGEWLPVDN